MVFDLESNAREHRRRLVGSTNGDGAGEETGDGGADPGARAEIVERLLTALDRERLLAPPLTEREADEFRAAGEPAEIVGELARAGRFAGPVPNLPRLLEELSDGVTGLARARAGLRERWAVAKQANTAGRASQESGFDALVRECRRRCLPGDRGPSALLARFEQLVGEGHPAHPCAKTSLGLGDGYRDVLPEQVERVTLRFAAVDPAKVVETGRPILEALGARLPALAGAIREELDARNIAGFAVIPVHPWQWEQVISTEFAAEIDAGRVVLLDATASAEPLMSVRTVRVGADDGSGAVHVKLALEAQLTGAIRGISRGALAGPAVSGSVRRALALDPGFIPRTGDDAPAFHVADDMAGVGFRAEEGIRAHCFGAIVRDDPAAPAIGEDVPLPIAALQASNPLTGRPILIDVFESIRGRAAVPMTVAEVAEAWFAALADVLVAPSIALLARWGVALEPHPQNAVLVLRDGMPRCAVVRDNGGARVVAGSRLAGATAADELMSSLEGTALVAGDRRAAVDKLSYPLLMNTIVGLARVAEDASVPASVPYGVVAERIAEEAARCSGAFSGLPGDGRLGDAEAVFEAMLGPELPLKRVLAMRLSGAVTDQEYVRVDNPLHGAAPARHRADDGEARRIVADRLETSARIEGVAPDRLAALARDTSNASDNLALTAAAVDRRLRGMRLREKAAGGAGRHWETLGTAPKQLAGPLADSLVVAGHNVHPLAKLRRGFSPADSVRFGPEHGPVVELLLVAVSEGLVEEVGVRGVEGELRRCYPDLFDAVDAEIGARAPHLIGASRIIPVHPWQYSSIIASEFSREVEEGLIVPATTATLPVRPTISLRTSVPVAPGIDGRRPMIKTALDVTLTSTRRSISQESALGTPAVADLVRTLADSVARREERPTIIVPEIAGVAYRGPRDEPAVRRGLSCLIREDPSALAGADEIVVGANSLRGLPAGEESPVAALAESDPRGWLRAYARDLLGLALPLMWRHGVALEAHLQNTMVRVAVDGGAVRYRGLMLRDFSGLRIFPPRLRESGFAVPARDGAVTVTDDVAEFRRKGHYALFFGNLDGIVEELRRVFGGDAAQWWAVVRRVVDDLLDEHRGHVPDGDAEALLGPTLDQKAFVTMALGTSGGDDYVAVPNPLLAPSHERERAGVVGR
ncbi:IucA/IucC family protein [Corynebacterium hansenii]|uniref:IucA/IucC family protein n=1 Tax=Corynebacterium hansenii TaxID=394964 RepID=A0ABV7ZPK9_9CORY|nr:IucA/IucC family protein [Corynebacterium hansenii]